MRSTVVEELQRPASRQRVERRPARSLPLSASERRILLASGDALAAIVAFGLANLGWQILTHHSAAVPGFGWALFAGGWVAALFAVNGYDLEIPASRVRSLVVVVKAALFATFVGSVVFLLSRPSGGRLFVLLSVPIGVAAITAMRLTLARGLLHETFAKRALIVGEVAEPGIAETLHAARYDYRVVGVVSESPDGAASLPTLGGIEELTSIVSRHRIDEVILANGRDGLRSPTAAELCFSHGIRVTTPMKLAERYLGRVPLRWVDSEWFLSLPPRDLYARPYLLARRIVDLLLSFVVSVPFLIALPVIAALIKLDSRGPVFFTQRRLGQHEKEFRLFKLRTMVVDAENQGHRWADLGDVRVTRMGRLLRGARIDEIPQVLNVLRGEMSFIGPRPERPEFVADLEEALPHYRVRLAVKPGISGWAQVKNGYASTVAAWHRKLEYDLYYVKHQSLRLDLQIAIHTMFTVMGLRGR